MGVALASALQDALKRTFLQHGKTTTKSGAKVTVAVEIDGRQRTVDIQRYSSFLHRDNGADLAARALSTGAVELAGWAYPGAAQRHIAFPTTKCEYNAGAAVAACFALVGCLSLQGTRMRAGVLVIPEPYDLLRFAVSRPRLTPRRVTDVFVAGTADAVLTVQVALRLDDVARKARGVVAVHGVLLRPTPWGTTTQKYRVATVTTSSVPESVLDLYHDLMQRLPARIMMRSSAAKEHGGGEGIFATTSALRGFIAENLAAGKRWFSGFATATTSEKKPRFIHYYRAQDNLGALYPDEREGLIAMLNYLEEAEAILVRSVHVALRHRFGAIAAETDNTQTKKNRWRSEWERRRLAFAGSKTAEQVRAALADLWSRGGQNQELKAGWEKVLPLLRPEHWQAARDLALVALASYQGASVTDEDDEPAPDANGRAA
jgi:CRISPR-associated protein Cas8a1/Csx13